MFKVVKKDPDHQHRVSAETGKCVTCGKTVEEIYQEDQ